MLLGSVSVQCLYPVQFQEVPRGEGGWWCYSAQFLFIIQSSFKQFLAEKVGVMTLYACGVVQYSCSVQCR